MNQAKTVEVGTRVAKSILHSIHQHLAEPDFDLDEGDVQLIDRDECGLYFGLFEVDSGTGHFSSELSILFTVEVFADSKGGR